MGHQFLLYSRPGCSLCEEMLLALAAHPAARDLPVEVRNIDLDESDRVRYGHKIPVLLLDGELVCHGRLDLEELLKSLASRGCPV
ncbi:MAG TPA: glutaredoxin family protein [Steroidobacteraceae bacterium]|nr:glutaredoxin family protein [Steroidobacteraceae bacterium]